ncbi:DNA repair protein REV1 isoform X2 [Pistacia vera]|uniref:DNA repair protein REV1 isoform X2 n=1 Tax=Pistacia vera TaxID=55513 RepID=UPI001263DDA9|nr:DNA repair protein REV1 isoform X2 [Pistacia vera]
MSSGSSRSANSGQKLKRSFNSIQSNSTNNSNTSVNNNKKNKKSNQKTLGVAWGSNSLSSSRSSFRNSPFSDFGSYMVEKNRKLQNQFDAEASSSSYSASTSGRPIFQGVSIFVDGFTVPSSQELRGYMLKYGGRFENYFSRHRVTHIICSNLPDSKIKNLRSFSGGLPVVKPAWVLDSVAANKLLSWVPYQLDQLANNQPKLSYFFALKRCHFSEDASIPTFYQAKPETVDSSLNNGSSKNADLSEQGGSVQHEWQIRVEIEDPVVAVMNEKMTEQQSSFTGKSCEVDTLEPSNADAEIESCVKDELQSRTHEPSPSISSYCVENRDMKGSMSSKKSHSTLGDPNFVENYFKSSRLHFIGTWRHRYRKRFPSCSEFKCTSSSLKVPSDAQRTAIFHVDMDCFFVSVIIRNHPELQDKPVAICHSDSVKGTAEISSANYPARDYGVKAGMFVRDAKALCPHLVICPYNFEAYEEVADQFYNILHKHCTRVQAVSCDEAFLDVTYLEVEDPEILASKIRKEIFETTGCTASTGIAGNMLMARLATRTAKPNGQCYIPPQRVDDYLHHLPIKALPGIGHVLEEKLRKQNIRTCGQLRMISKDSLQKDFGVKTGEMLWNYSRGIDNRQVGLIQESKSIGAEVNWGVRFRDLKDSHHFLLNLCKEVSLRLQGCGVQGRNFTLKIKKRKKDANEPVKYMGCGDCDNFSHSMTVPVATDDVEVLQRITKQLFGSFHFDVKDIRGIGLQVSKLENADPNKQGIERNTLKSWLTSTSASTEEKSNISRMSEGGTDAIQLSVQMDLNLSTGQDSLNQVSAVPPLCDLDVGVIENLPPELFSELNGIYGGKLFDLITKNRDKSDNISSYSSNPPHELEGALNEGRGSLFSELVNLNEELVAMKCAVEEVPAVPVLGAGLFNEAIPNLVRDKIDLMPSSLSQVDTSVLQQLPEPLRADILELLPAHRRQAFSSNATLGPSENLQESMGTKIPENPAGSIDAVGNNNLWVGNPPLWVDKFKASNFLILNMLADIYHKYGSTGNLSQILQHTVSVTVHPPDASSDGWDEAIDNLCELLRQYIKLNIEVDIEEIYVCFRLLRRIMAKSEFFLEVYNTVIPYLQTSVGQNYGGRMHVTS